MLQRGRAKSDRSLGASADSTLASGDERNPQPTPPAGVATRKVIQMATTVAAMKAELGSTSYYILSMKAKELEKSVTIPKEWDGWEDLSVEERYQRDINYARVKKQIAPYLARDDNRFFGAVIVAAQNFDHETAFEPLSDVLKRTLPNLYRTVASSIGFLTFSGGELLVPLDGQHRLKAIKFALEGKDERDRDIPGLKPSTKLGQDDVTVILVPYEKSKAREIFTRVNRYAKPTTTGQNIVTDDDDICAVITRKVANDIIGGRLAKYNSNTIRPKDAEFTTLSIIYNCNKDIIEKTFCEGRLDTTQLPDQSKQDLFKDKCYEVWETLKDSIDTFADALSDPDESGDAKRIEIRSGSLLGKPVTQECLVRAFLILTGKTVNFSSMEACDRLNRLPWGIDNEENLKIWDQILWTGGTTHGRVLTKNRTLAVEMIAYMAGRPLSEEQLQQLLSDYRNKFPESRASTLELPKVVD